jgi:hypothetical protein
MKVNYPTSKEFNILGNFPIITQKIKQKKLFRKFPQLQKLKAAIRVAMTFVTLEQAWAILRCVVAMM